MKKVVTLGYWKVDPTKARNVLEARRIEHTYGEASSVCSLAGINEARPSFDGPYDMGIVTMEDLELLENSFTMKDVLERCREKGYEKPVFSDIINYIDVLGDYRFYSQTAVMSIMDEVTDGDFCSGRVYLQPDSEGYLYSLGFIKVDETKSLSKTARFFVKKIKE